MDSLYHLCLFFLAQTQTIPTDGGAVKGAEEAAKNPGFFESMGFMLPAMLGVMVLYVLMSSRQPAASGAGGESELLANLKKNDQVLTAGGILGTVVNYRPDSEYATLRVDDATNARMQVLATSIIRVVSDETEDTKKIELIAGELSFETLDELSKFTLVADRSRLKLRETSFE